MKKLSLLLLTTAIAFSAFAQDKPSVSTEKNVLKVNTLSFFLGTGSVFFEHKLTDLTSGQLGAGYMNFQLRDTKFTGLILTPELRIYTKKNAIDGFYIAPYARYHKFTLENEDLGSKGTLSGFGGGLLFGRQWITNSGFTMDLFFGGHYGRSDVKVESEFASVEDFDEKFFEGFKMRIGFALGFAF